MNAIKIVITRFISDHYPGFVECKFNDAWNKEHIIHEKVPVITLKDLDATSEYPQEGVIACEILKQWTDNDKGKIFTVTTEKPWGVYTTDDLTEFDILAEQLLELNHL